MTIVVESHSSVKKCLKIHAVVREKKPFKASKAKPDDKRTDMG